MSKRKKILLWAGGVLSALLVVGQFAPPEKPAAGPIIEEVPATMPATVPMPVVIGKTGKQGQEEVWAKSNNKRFAVLADAEPVVGCTTLTQSAALIVRTDPMPGVDINIDDGSQVIRLFVDRASGPPCPAPPPPTNVNINPPNANVPNYDAPEVRVGGGGGGGNGGESRLCRGRWWC